MANSTPRRRSARLNGKTAASPRSTVRKTPQLSALGSLLERDETPEAGASIDNVLTTPATEATLRQRILQLTSLKTPCTEPHPSRAEMHPKTIHQTTTKAPDSGLKLGFVNISAQKALHDTPSKLDAVEHLSSPTFEFKFASESHLSNEAKTLMEHVREEAARIKAQMQAEKTAQDDKDGEAEEHFSGINATGRKIAQPKGRAGRFSDVHMAQFKKMDSIANHASAFRAKATFAQPTQRSLKRSGSRAGLDEPERPRTAGKGTPGKAPPPFVAPTSSVSPFKSISHPKISSDRPEDASPAKRARLSAFHRSSARHVLDEANEPSFKPSTLPRPVSGSLLSPTKASLARTASTKTATMPTTKPPMLPKSNSTKSLRAAFEAARLPAELQRPNSSESTFKIPRSETTKASRPLPPVPIRIDETQQQGHPSFLQKSQSTKTMVDTPRPGGFASKLPTFAGLKSILRSSRPASSRKAPLMEKPDTPKRPNTANAAIESAKKVDFTPSVKSRYAVKLAANSPSPAKQLPSNPATYATPDDPAGYETDEEDEENWEDAESEVDYPMLPPQSPEAAPVVHTFSAKAKEHNRRESKEFKSIFTTLHQPSRPIQPSNLTTVNTIVNKTNPAIHVDKIMRSPSNPTMSKQSPSIRRVRTSEAPALVQPFEDTIQTVSHGLSAKKRRYESALQDDKHGLDEDSKENRRISAKPQIPGGWEESLLEEDEGEKRGGKRIRVAASEEPPAKKADPKKPSAARQAAAKSAQERKGKGILSMSRLNMLSRPKQRD